MSEPRVVVGGEPVAHMHGITLPPGLEIRLLNADAAPWVQAIFSFVGCYESLLWAPMYHPANGRILLQGHNTDSWRTKMAGLVSQGLTFGVFDTNYQFRRPESAAEGGAVHWDHLEPPLDDQDEEAAAALRQELLDGMDFPLIAVAASADAYEPPKPSSPPAQSNDPAPVSPWPYRPEWFSQFSKLDTRPPESWKPTAAGQLVSRSGTGTRPGYEGRGLMTALTRFVTLEMRHRGFRAIQGGVQSSSVAKVWMNMPTPIRSTVVVDADVSKFEATYQKDDGEVVKIPFAKAVAKRGQTIWMDLYPEKM